MIIFKIKEFPFVFMIAKEKKKTNLGYQKKLNRLVVGIH